MDGFSTSTTTTAITTTLSNLTTTPSSTTTPAGFLVFFVFFFFFFFLIVFKNKKVGVPELVVRQVGQFVAFVLWTTPGWLLVIRSKEGENKRT